MKRFRFGLASLLRVKQQRERLAEVQVVQARQAVTLCQQHLDQLNQALKDVSDLLERSIGTALAVEAWAGAFDQSARLERAIHDGEAALAQAEERLRQAVEARVRLSTEVEALLTLREERLDLHRQEAQRAEQVRLDEAVMRQWMQNRRDERQDDPNGG